MTDLTAEAAARVNRGVAEMVRQLTPRRVGSIDTVIQSATPGQLTVNPAHMAVYGPGEQTPIGDDTYTPVVGTITAFAGWEDDGLPEALDSNETWAFVQVISTLAFDLAHDLEQKARVVQEMYADTGHEDAIRRRVLVVARDAQVTFRVHDGYCSVNAELDATYLAIVDPPEQVAEDVDIADPAFTTVWGQLPSGDEEE